VIEGRVGREKKGKNIQIPLSIFLLFFESLEQILAGMKLPPANNLNAGPCWLRERTIVWIAVR